MAKTMYRKLLEHLSNNIEIDYVDLLKYFKEYHPETQTEDYLDAVRTTILDLSRDNYIKIKEDNFPVGNIGTITNYVGQNIIFTLDHAMKPDVWGERLKAKITTEGRHHLSDIIRNEKQDVLNDAIKKTNFWQIILTVVIALATIAQVIVAYKSNNTSFEVPKVQTNEQKEAVRLLEERLSNKEKTDSVLFRQIKDSLNSISERTK